jgi:hypothetical protein
MSFKIRPCLGSTIDKPKFEVGCIVIDADPLNPDKVWCTVATRKDPKEAAQLCNYLNGAEVSTSKEAIMLSWITPKSVFTVEGI